ncbi:MAG: histidinol dehydrogenase [Candidatus Hydrogenedens sp.]|nr:histidinol dehydrogenase [Candidatus Hydrogenedens sp.]
MRSITIQNDADLEAARKTIIAFGDVDDTNSGIHEKIGQTREIVDAVRLRGDAAVREFTARFDGADIAPEDFEVRPEAIDAALKAIDPSLAAILQRAFDNIRRFHERALRQGWEETYDDGTVLGQRITPIASAGVYVPGGKAFYPSSVLMNIAPAQVAGVHDIIMVSPPSYEGGIHPAVLAAAKIAGATRVFRVGGAQAIAALAYGTETIPAVNKITGPGNTFVTAAKSLVRHRVDIDSEAGPSEVAVLADASANPEFVAAEMLAQAEHDEEAKALLITDSPELAQAVAALLPVRAAALPRRAIIEKSLENFGLAIVTRTPEEAIVLTNLFAPEHLSIQTEDPRTTATQITDAGAMMLGAYTPVAVGDYYAGPNHILPTNRRARFSSPLTAEDFRKVTSVLHYSEARLQGQGPDIMQFAGVEELQAHARSIEVRIRPGVAEES